MDEITDSEQLAELESLLYSQIHYSADTELTPPDMSSDSPIPHIEAPIKSNQNQYAPSRYFGQQTYNVPKNDKMTYTNVVQTKPSTITAATTTNIASSTSTNNANTAPNQNTNQHSNNEMQTLHIHQPIQLQIQPPVNNIVFMAPANIPPLMPSGNNMTKNQRRKMNKQLRKSHQLTIQQAIHDAEVFRRLNHEDRAIVIKMQKKQNYLARKKEKIKLMKEQQLINKFNQGIKEPVINKPAFVKENPKPAIVSDVIVLSETDEDEIVAVEPVIDMVIISDDEVIHSETTKLQTEDNKLPTVVNEEDDSSVQFVETPVEEPIILDLDADLDVPPESKPGPSSLDKTDAEMMKPPSDPSDHESTSLSSAASAQSSERIENQNINAPKTPKSQKLQKHKDLLNTPESSNDFLDTSIDVSQGNFNFSLHGNDLGVEKGFLKPKSLAETYESESSCSASDISSVKNPVFNELEFESPTKPLFSEADLDLGSFSEYITPKRKVGIPSLLTPVVNESDKPKDKESAAKNLSCNSESESSSESELDDDGIIDANIAKIAKRKRLPSLSHFEIGEIQAKSSPISVKKGSVKAKVKDKFDFIKDAVEDADRLEQEQNQNEDISKYADKSMKNKKHKQKLSENINDNGVEDQSNKTDSEVVMDLNLGSGKKRKRQKSKSDTDTEKTVTEKTKSPLKGKKTKSDGDDDDDDNPNLNSNKKSNTKKKLKASEDNTEPKSTSSPITENCKTMKTKDVTADLKETEVETTDSTQQPGNGRNARRKRKSRSESNNESSPKSDTAIDKRKKIDEDDNIQNEELNVSIDSKNDCDTSDIQIVELPPPVCICLSSDDESEKDNSIEVKKKKEDSSDDEQHFNCEELDKLDTDLSLSNVLNDSQNSWEVQSEQNVSIVYDTNKSDERVVSLIAHSNVGGTATKGLVVEDNQQSDVFVEEQKSWCTPGFDIDTAFASMSEDSSKWKIMERDRIHIRYAERGKRCKKCREFGHLAYECDRVIMRCWLCGQEGHQEPRCPNAVCTTCGQPTRFFTPNCGRCRTVNSRCSYCDSRGHITYLCPDFWRRYHLTTEPGELIAPKHNSHPLKPNRERWCSGCAKPGHFEYTCNYYNRTHNPASPQIFKYHDVYNMTKQRRPQKTNTGSSAQKSSVDGPIRDRIRMLEDEASGKKQEECRQDRITTRGGTQQVNTTNEDDSFVEHKRMTSYHHLNKVAVQMLETTKGKEFCKILFDSLHIAFSFESKGDNGILKVCGYPTDLLKASATINKFVSNTQRTDHTFKLTVSKWESLQTKLDFVAETSQKYNISYTLNATNKSIDFKGHVFDILIAEHTLQTAIDAEKLMKVKKSIHAKKENIDNLRLHPRMKFLADKFSIEWSLKKNSVSLIGTEQNINQIVEALSDINIKDIRCSYPILKRVNELLSYAHNPPNVTVEFVENFVKKNDVEVLNVLYHLNDSKYTQLQRLCKDVTESMFMNPRAFNHANRLLRFFNRQKGRQVYMRHFFTDSMQQLPPQIEQKQLQQQPQQSSTDLESSTLDLYNLDNMPQTSGELKSYFIKLPPASVRHLLKTADGNDFFNQLNISCPMEVKKDGTALKVYCDKKQYHETKKIIRNYFFFLSLQFPNSLPKIQNELTTCLAEAKLNYYTTNCLELYNKIKHSSSPDQVKNLNGLLFTKYQFLDGPKHMETITAFMNVAYHKNSLLISEYRKLRAAALYLFCPAFMPDVDYIALINAAVPPDVPKLAAYVQSDYVILKDQIQRELNRYNNDVSCYGLCKKKELTILCEYLESQNYSTESLSVAKLFLQEQGK